MVHRDKHRSTGHHGSSTGQRENKPRDSVQMWFCHECGDGPMFIEIVPACPQFTCAHWRCTDCPIKYYELIDDSYRGSPRPSTSAKPDIPSHSAAPDSNDQPVVVETNQDTRPPLEQKANGSQQRPDVLPNDGDGHINSGSNLTEAQGKDAVSQPPLDNEEEKRKVRPEAELPLHERTRQQDDEIRDPLVVPTVSDRKRWAGFDIEEGHRDDGGDEGEDGSQVENSNEPIFYEQFPSSDVLNGWLLPSFSQKIRDLLLQEPTIPAGMSRIRWECPCGEILYDDYQELKPGGAKRMEEYLRRSFYKKCAGDGRNLAQRISNSGSSLKGLITSIGQRVQTFKSREPRELVNTELRYYSDARTTRTPAHTSGEVFYLLLCHNSGIGAEVLKLRQPDICDINNDHKLFSFLHEEYTTLRKRWWTWISLWTLRSIKFVKFELHENELVDIKKLDEVPPPTKDNEYRHGPPNPPEVIPPLGSNLLMHLFKHPELAGIRKHCLKKIPRKLRSRLAVIDEEDDAIGWGLQFIEGWSKKRLMYMTALTFGLSSFVVMVLVSILGHDIQNAAAIASFMLSFVTIGIATAQAALHMT